MLARSRQLQGIFGLLKPFLHVQILICFVDVYQNHGVLYGTAAKTHTRFYNSGKISRGGERGFGFYGLKGSSALIMPHLKLPCHTLAQFRLAGSFSFSTNQPHPCMQTPRRRWLQITVHVEPTQRRNFCAIGCVNSYRRELWIRGNKYLESTSYSMMLASREPKILVEWGRDRTNQHPTHKPPN